MSVPSETVPKVTELDSVEKQSKLMKAFEEIQSDPSFKARFWELHKELTSPVDLGDKLYSTYKNDPFRLNYNTIQSAPIEDVKQFVNLRLHADSRNRITNLTGFAKEYADILNDCNFLLYCRSVEGVEGNKWGTEDSIAKQYRTAAYSLLKMMRMGSYFADKAVGKADLDKYCLKKTSIFKKRITKNKKETESKPKKDDSKTN